MKNYHFSLVVRKAFVNSIPLHMFFPFLKEGRHRGFPRNDAVLLVRRWSQRLPGLNSHHSVFRSGRPAQDPSHSFLHLVQLRGWGRGGSHRHVFHWLQLERATKQYGEWFPLTLRQRGGRSSRRRVEAQWRPKSRAELQSGGRK